MNLDEAKQVGERLAAAVEAGSETRWAYSAALWTFPSPPIVDPWQPRGKPMLTWLDADGLITVEGFENARIQFSGRPVTGSAWKFEVTFQSARIDNHGLATDGLKTHWSFLLPGGEDFSIDGEILVTREDSTPDHAETLAQAIASRMMGRPDLTTPSDSV